jgi:hypothetical protein
LPRSELQFGFVLSQGWRWLDQIPGNTAIQQYEFSKNIAQVADSLRYDSAYAYDHLWGGSYFKYNRTKNFFECFALLSSIIANIFYLIDSICKIMLSISLLFLSTYVGDSISAQFISLLSIR